MIANTVFKSHFILYDMMIISLISTFCLIFVGSTEVVDPLAACNLYGQALVNHRTVQKSEKI